MTTTERDGVLPWLELGTARLDHQVLGLPDERLVEMYRCMLLARRMDDRMWALNRQGRAPFVVSSSGHEAVQVASVFAFDPEIDWLLPYYRDMGVALAWGSPVVDVLAAVFTRKTDPTSGGRQLPNHWSDPDRRVLTHSSTIATQYPHAAGIAQALRLDGRPGVVAVYGGEGSTSEGDWHEMMNFAGIHSLPLICIIENNRYAISVAEAEQVGGRIVDRANGYGVTGVEVDGNDPLAVYAVVREAADRARSGAGATLVEAHTYRYYAHTSDDDDRLYRTREEVDLWRRHDPLAVLKQYLIEARLLSERDEEAMESSIAEELAAAVTEAEGAPEPDDPYSHVYANPIVPEEPATGPEPEPGGESVNLITAINMTLHEILEAYPETVVFGEDVADPKGGVFKATQGLSDRFGGNRCFNTPIAESLIAGLAVGMAATGKTPLAELQFADYVHPAFDQIVSEIARIHYRSNGRWRMPIVLRAPFGGGIHGALYHSQSIEAYYSHVPGLKVVIPSTPADAKGLLWSAVEDPDPVFYMEPKKLYRLGRYPFPEGEWKVPIGKARVRRAGSKLTLLTYGAMTHFSLEAAAALDGEGIDIEVIDLRSLRPLDWPTIETSVQKTSRVLIVHEDNEFGGYGAELAAQLVDKGFEWLDAPVRRYCAPEVPNFPFAQAMEDMTYPSTEGIITRAKSLVEW